MNTGSSSKQTILIVDDIAENIQILTNILSDEYRVLAATNGQNAVEIAMSPPIPDLILLDVMMPGMDGFEACRIIKSDPVSSSIPVIFVTAKTDTVDEKLGFELGAVDYITKPVSPIVVLARIKTQLG